jgi:hypothetical protein
MAKFRIPGAEGQRMILRDLRSGHAGWLVRVGLSLVSAAAILSVAMVCLGLLEAASGRLRDEHLALTMGVAGATWCSVLALLWWTFQRFQLALKSVFAILATWAIVLPATLLIDSIMRRGEEYLIAAAVFLGIACSIALIILICYRRFRAGPTARAIVHMRMACPECGYSLVGLTDCRCPECGSQYTVETLVEALGRGQVLAETAIRPSEPAPEIETLPTPHALPEPN